MVATIELLKQDAAHQQHSFNCQARVQKPAPYFSTTALVNGEFQQVSLTDYQGIYSC
jgi:hypothetical protein